MSAIKELSKDVGRDWVEILKAEKASIESKRKIESALQAKVPMTSSDTDVVVFGSIARNECTAKSDVDWTLLVDGQADPHHLDIAQLIRQSIVQSGLKVPGTSGMFGQITFSHDLIHYIGGEDDTNHNLSRRILLLLESDVIIANDNNGSALPRVIKHIISKYIDNDSGYSQSGGENVPRFLLNDIIRFWRTMCVDFAKKQIDQKGQNWAIRNIKLRMSRKLIFIKGLLMCAKLYKTKQKQDEIKSSLFNFVKEKPLEFIVKTLREFKIDDKNIASLLDSYDDYLKMLNDADIRDEIEGLHMHKAYGNAKFEKARNNSHKFQDSLNKIFLKGDDDLNQFMLQYSVF